MTKPFEQQVEHALAELEPPLRIVSSETFDTFDDAIVVLDDGPVLWRLIRERSDVGVQAASSQHASEWYDIAPIERVLGTAASSSTGFPAQSLDKAMQRLTAVRPAVRQAFARDWNATRRALKREVDAWNAEIGRPSRSRHD